MLMRALIVLLLVLNLGVAAWWVARPTAAAPAPDLQPADVPRLQLLGETVAPRVPEAPADPAASAPPPAPEASATVAAANGTGPAAAQAETVQPAQCFSLGPFDSEAGTRAALSALGLEARRASRRQQPGRGASGYKVYLPAMEDRAAAQAMAARIGAAGFDDYLIINSGELANAIALGLFGTKQAAERRVAALQAAGFAAQIQPTGSEKAAQWWLDLRAPAGLSRQQAQARSLAAQSWPLDCATLR
ncbi:MAG TPA: SPOR domain-containing protein [Pseudoxanthomonas sp.]|nr:SPOR domain-containing protein [Pseudoxanthomonas sp.]